MKTEESDFVTAFGCVCVYVSICVFWLKKRTKTNIQRMKEAHLKLVCPVFIKTSTATYDTFVQFSLTMQSRSLQHYSNGIKCTNNSTNIPSAHRKRSTTVRFACRSFTNQLQCDHCSFFAARIFSVGLFFYCFSL